MIWLLSWLGYKAKYRRDTLSYCDFNNSTMEPVLKISDFSSNSDFNLFHIIRKSYSLNVFKEYKRVNIPKQ